MDLIIEAIDVAHFSGEALAREKIYVSGIAFISIWTLRPVIGQVKIWFNRRLWLRLTPLTKH